VVPLHLVVLWRRMTRIGMIEKRFSPLYGIAMEMMEENLLEKKEKEEI
jgi:hypothetical protein